MKINAKVAKGSGVFAYRAARWFVLKFPALIAEIRRNSRDLGIYAVTIGKHEVRVILSNPMAQEAIANRQDHQPSVQYIWKQAQHEVAITPEYQGIKVPQLHAWRNVDRDGNPIVPIRKLRDASAAERKCAEFSFLRDALAGIYVDLTATA